MNSTENEGITRRPIGNNLSKILQKFKLLAQKQKEESKLSEISKNKDESEATKLPENEKSVELTKKENPSEEEKNDNRKSDQYNEVQSEDLIHKPAKSDTNRNQEIARTNPKETDHRGCIYLLPSPKSSITDWDKDTGKTKDNATTEVQTEELIQEPREKKIADNVSNTPKNQEIAKTDLVEEKVISNNENCVQKVGDCIILSPTPKSSNVNLKWETSSEAPFNCNRKNFRKKQNFYQNKNLRCPSCKNKPYDDIMCRICSFPKVNISARLDMTKAEEKPWKCELCGDENLASANKCKVCQRVKSKDKKDGSTLLVPARKIPNIDINFSSYEEHAFTIMVFDPEWPIPKFIVPIGATTLNSSLLKSIEKFGYKKLTTLQNQVIPVISTNRNLVCCAPSGSGKTMGYLLPIIHLLLLVNDPPSNSPVCVILLPTVKFVSETFEETQKLISCSSNLKVCLGDENVQLKVNCHILIATPVCLLNLLGNSIVNLKGTRFIMMDEVDRMVDMGSMPQISKIMNHQTLSAKVEWDKLKKIIEMSTTSGNNQEKAQPKYWTCKDCKTVNYPFRTKCFRCHRPKETSAVQESDYWECAVCGFSKNFPFFVRCNGCSSMKGKEKGKAPSVHSESRLSTENSTNSGKEAAEKFFDQILKKSNQVQSTDKKAEKQQNDIENQKSKISTKSLESRQDNSSETESQIAISKFKVAPTIEIHYEPFIQYVCTKVIHERPGKISKPIDSFLESDLNRNFVEAMRKHKFIEATPTPFQKSAIPLMLKKIDLLGLVQKDSGRKVGYLMSIFQLLMQENRDLSSGEVRCLILTPTFDTLRRLGGLTMMMWSATPLNFKILLLDGNSEWKVNAGFHILIATPESLLKLVVDSKLHFKNTEYVVFDDVDLMVEVGQMKLIDEIMSHPTMKNKDERQTFMFTSTHNEYIQKMANKYLNNFVFLKVSLESSPSSLEL